MTELEHLKKRLSKIEQGIVDLQAQATLLVVDISNLEAKALEEKKEIANIEHVETVAEKDSATEDSVMNQFMGENSLFVEFLSPEVITGGKGKIRPTKSLPQFEESITHAPLFRVMGWPTGFYLDYVTREVQFLLHVDDVHAFIVTGLPNTDKVVQVCEQITQLDPGKLYAVTEMNKGVAEALAVRARQALKSITEDHFA